eukprot:IDg8194t1
MPKKTTVQETATKKLTKASTTRGPSSWHRVLDGRFLLLGSRVVFETQQLKPVNWNFTSAHQNVSDSTQTLRKVNCIT